MIGDSYNFCRSLLQQELVTIKELQQFVQVATETGKDIVQVINHSGKVDKEIIEQLVLYDTQLQYVDLSKLEPDWALWGKIPMELLFRYECIPIKWTYGMITVAVAEPLGEVEQKDFSSLLGMNIRYDQGDRKTIENLLLRYLYETHVEQEGLASEGGGEVIYPVGKFRYVGEKQIETIVAFMLGKAAQVRASDVHVEPYEKEITIRLRIDGQLMDFWSLPKGIYSPLVTRLKLMAKLDIGEKRLPQDGRMAIRYEERIINVRVSTLPMIFGEKVCLRLLREDEGLEQLEQLGFSSRNLLLVEKLLQVPRGLILVTGPTNSGKTTSLYGMIRRLRLNKRNITTIEDPVESIIPGVNQVQVNEKAGLTFEQGLRGILRQDPDVIMIGEIRDKETADIAIRAAVTGQLVLATLHTNDSISAILRLLEMEVDSFLLAHCLRGVISQRLVRQVCSSCHNHLDQHGVTAVECKQCNDTGYFGLIALHEVFTIGEEEQVKLTRDVSLEQLQRMAEAQGMISLKQDGLEKVTRGITTEEEVFIATLL